MSTVLLLGGFQPGQSLWSIQRGFEAQGHEAIFIPTRGCIRANLEVDIALAKEEADLIPDASEWDLKYEDADGFREALFRTVEERKPELLLWWFSKDDRPPGLIRDLREKYPWCKTVTHTQDDPWDVLRSPHFTEEFEFTATCCKESVEVYAERGIRAIVLYPPPSMELHRTATLASGESCDLSVTIMSLYSRQGGSEEEYLESEDLVKRITHTIPFPDMRVLREEMVAAIQYLGRVHIYGGLDSGPSKESPDPRIAAFEATSSCPACTPRRRSTSTSTTRRSLTAT